MPGSTVVDLLSERVQRSGAQTAYTYLVDGEAQRASLTWSELDRRASEVAARIRECGATAAGRALLLYPPGLDFLVGLFGSLYAGWTAVPSYPPDPFRVARTLPRLRAIREDCGATLVLTTAGLQTAGEALFDHAPELRELDWIATDVGGSRGAWRRARARPDDLAVIQYTSGSTGAPKGVLLSHANLLANLRVIQRAFGIDGDTTLGGWLPVYHDLGLIGMLLSSCYTGAHCVSMSPIHFLQKPSRWLRMMSDYRCEISGGPNFSYDLCVRKTPEPVRETLDLSAWRVAINAAEPVRAESIRRFADAFAASGFRREAMRPCYGLAEATLLVTASTADREPRLRRIDRRAYEAGRVVEAEQGEPRAMTVVSSGRPVVSALRIVDAASGRACGEGEVGEIWVSDPSVAHGYWKRSEESARVFGASLASGEGRHLRTGDLGFLSDGELFISGRVKDLIVVRGVNHHPQDIEATVERSHPALRPGCGAAFSIEVGGEERVVVAHEVESARAQEVETAAAEIARAVLEAHDLELHELVLIEPRTLPKTSSGKIQRRATRQGYLDGGLAELARCAGRRLPARTPSAIEAWLVARLRAPLGSERGRIARDRTFAELGLDSAALAELAGELEEWLGTAVSPTAFFEFPTLAALATALGERKPSASALQTVRRTADEPIAIVGMACRFPGAPRIDDFWDLLRGGAAAIGEVPADRWDWRERHADRAGIPGRTHARWGGFLERVAEFDAEFFGMPRAEALETDPQHRLLLEVAWEALEHAGIPADEIRGRSFGVYVGLSTSDYYALQLRAGLGDGVYAGVGSSHSIAANRLSHFLGACGPSLAIDTACSSSLVAVHLACQALRLGECERALVGGVNLLLSPELTVSFSQGGFMASDGLCKTFDHRADGYVRSEGAGVVVLEPLSLARERGDPILALVRGSAVNNDGPSNGLTAPSLGAQLAVLREAYARAGVDADSVQYVEAHGTGTPLGDPIEAEALGRALAGPRRADQPCWVGSVKTNLGHLEAAAGIAGLIKVVLSLERGEIPAHLHLERVNPRIDLAALGLAVPTARRPWPRTLEPRRAGVSAFGFGGTNAHVVLEEGPIEGSGSEASAEREAGAWVLPVSARSGAALREVASGLRGVLSRAADEAVSDVVYTASVRRTHHRVRAAVVGRDRESLCAELEALASGAQEPAVAEGGRLGFLFSGQGTQWSGMGLELCEREPAFRQALEACESAYEVVGGRGRIRSLWAASEAELSQAEWAQPALFALQVSLAALYRSWGIEPDAVVGHSAGEVAASHVSGALTLPAAMRVAVERGRALQSATDGGGMLAVRAEARALREVLGEEAEATSVAAYNGPRSLVLAGRSESLAAAQQRLTRAGIETHPLGVRYAFHSAQVAPCAEAVVEALAGLEAAEPSLAVASTVTGARVEGAGAFEAAYWGRNVREPVRYAAALEALAAEGVTTYLELGAHPVLAATSLETLRGAGAPSPRVVATLRRGASAELAVRRALASLYAAGQPVDWSALFPRPRRVVSLPSYPWQRRRYWFTDRSPAKASRANERPGAPSVYTVEWRPLDASAPTAPAAGAWWILSRDDSVGAAQLENEIVKRGGRCIRVPIGPNDGPLDPAALSEAARRVARAADCRAVVYLDGASPPAGGVSARGAAGRCEVAHALVEAVARAGLARPPRLWWVTRGAQSAASTPARVDPAQRAVWGFLRVVAQELPELRASCVDLDPEAYADTVGLADLLLEDPDEDAIALRSGRRLVARVAPGELGQDTVDLALREDATYLVSGGGGGLGRRLLPWLVERGARSLVVVGRQATSLDLGSDVSLVFERADISDARAVAEVLARIDRRGRPLRGVFHLAGVRDDALLPNLTPERIRDVLAAKAAGAFHLDALTRDLPLDCFVLFSSVAAWLGGAGQAGYAAANAYLDGLAERRRSEGLPALSIGWGPWVGAGMAADPVVTERLAREGLASMEAQAALDRLGALQRAPSLSHALVIGLGDGAQFRRALPLLRELAADAPAPAPSPLRPLLSQLRAAPSPRARRRTLKDHLLREIATVMEVSPRDVDSQRPLTELGLDSLLLVRLRSRLEDTLGLSLSAATLWSYPTVEKLVPELGVRLGLDDSEDARPTDEIARALREAIRS